MSTTGSDDTAADERQEVEPERQNLPINSDGNRVFTSTPGPELDNFQHDTLDVIRAERERAKWRPNPLDLPPGVDPQILRDHPIVPEQPNVSFDTQPPRKQGFNTAVEKGHHPEWTDARRVQQEGFWGPYTQTTAASRDSAADINDVHDSEDAWSQGSVYDPGHPWDPHHDQHWARPHLFRLPKTQWKQRVERPEIGHRQIRAPDAYWDPDRWDPEFKRRGRWVLPTGERLSKTKGFEMKLIPIGGTGGNRYFKPLTRQNILYWIDAVDKLDPAKHPANGIDWRLKNSDRRVLSWRDQFNPPDHTETEWMEQYDEDSRHQWEDLQAIHPSEWKTMHQMGNTLPPEVDNDYTDWKAKYQPPSDDSSHGESASSRSRSGKKPMGVGGKKYLKGNDDPSSEPQDSTGMSVGQKAALVGGSAVLLSGLIGIGKWVWDKYVKKRKEDESIQARGENEITLMVEESVAGRKMIRRHPREWVRASEHETKVIW